MSGAALRSSPALKTPMNNAVKTLCDVGSQQAHAIVASERQLALHKAEGFESRTGIGVRGTVGSKVLALGHTSLLEQLGLKLAH